MREVREGGEEEVRGEGGESETLICLTMQAYQQFNNRWKKELMSGKVRISTYNYPTCACAAGVK